MNATRAGSRATSTWVVALGGAAVLALLGAVGYVAVDRADASHAARPPAGLSVPSTALPPSAVGTQVGAAPASDLPIAGLPSAGLPAGSSADQTLVAMVRSQSTYYRSASSAEIVSLAHESCAALASGETFAQLGADALAHGIPPYDRGVVVGAGIVFYCPQFHSMIPH